MLCTALCFAMTVFSHAEEISQAQVSGGTTTEALSPDTDDDLMTLAAFAAVAVLGVGILRTKKN